MAYTIVKSNGTILTTIADGTINTTSTSVGLPGRNYAGYGQAQLLGIVHHLENFAASTPPANPLRGQLWFNINNNTMYVCPTDGETNIANWMSLTSTSSGGTTTFGNATVSGSLVANDITATNNVEANLVSTSYLTVTNSANISNVNITSANVTGSLVSSNITSGSTTTPGNISGIWTFKGQSGPGGNAAIFDTGGIYISNSGGANIYGIKCDNYMYANGTPISFAGTYSNANVAAYLPTFNGNILTVKTTATQLTTGANITAGTITGNWTLTAGSKLNATYADISERQKSDKPYPIGTVVKVGGINDITSASEYEDHLVIGVVSNNYAFLMNAESGPDETHPPVGFMGRVPVRIVGPVNKHDKIRTADFGCAKASEDTSIGFGYALESNPDENEKLVLCLIK